MLRELMFAVHEHMFMLRELMFAVREHNFSHSKNTSFRWIHQIIPFRKKKSCHRKGGMTVCIRIP